MNTAGNILFLPHSPAAFSEMLEVALPLQQKTRFTPVFVLDGPGYEAALQVCQEQGIPYRLVGNQFSKNPQQSTEKNRTSSHRPVVNFLLKLKKSFFPQFALAFLQYARLRQRAQHLLAEINPRAILLIGDRHIGLETALVMLANRMVIPSLIVPYALSDKEGGALYRRAASDWRHIYGMESWLNRIVARLRPGWSYTHNGETLLWQPPAAMLSAAFWGIMPVNPWALGGGASWVMIVESQHTKVNMANQGVPAEKIIVAGKPRYDQAAYFWQQRAETRRQVCDALRIDPAKKLLACAVPQLGEHDLLPWDQHWAETEFLFRIFSSVLPHANVVLSLHPKSDLAQYAPRAAQYGLVIAPQRYDQLIPISDLFVASYSSTVTLAIAAHIPVVIVDFFNFDYDFFDDVKGIIVLRQREELLSTLQRILADEDYHQQLVEGQAQAACYWARFDGKATERILDLMAELIERAEEIRKLPKRAQRSVLPPWSQ